MGASSFKQFRYRVNEWYESSGPQGFVALLIIMSFAVDCVEAQVGIGCRLQGLGFRFEGLGFRLRG